MNQPEEIEKRAFPERKIGENSQDFFLLTAIKVAEKVCNKQIYLFSGFTSDDCYQQALLYCLELRDSFDAQRGSLENWLSRSVKRRLLNHRRDHYLRVDDPNKSAKLALLSPVGVEHDERTCQDSDAAILLSEIEDKLPANLRGDWLRMKDGASVSGHHRRKVLAALLDIVSARHFDGKTLRAMTTTDILEEIRWWIRD